MSSGVEHKFGLIDGPYDGWTGEFWDQGQVVTHWGPEGPAKNFVYRRVRKTRKGKVLFRYDRHETRKALMASGADPSLADLAAADAPVRLTRPEVPSSPEVCKLQVAVIPRGSVYELRVDGEIVETVAAERINGDKEAAMAWVRSVMFPEKEAV